MPRKRNRIINEEPEDLNNEELDVQVGEIQLKILGKERDIEAAQRLAQNLKEEIKTLKLTLKKSKGEISKRS